MVNPSMGGAVDRVVVDHVGNQRHFIQVGLAVALIVMPLTLAVGIGSHRIKIHAAQGRFQINHRGIVRTNRPQRERHEGRQTPGTGTGTGMVSETMVWLSSADPAWLKIGDAKEALPVPGATKRRSLSIGQSGRHPRMVGTAVVGPGFLIMRSSRSDSPITAPATSR